MASLKLAAVAMMEEYQKVITRVRSNLCCHNVVYVAHFSTLPSNGVVSHCDAAWLLLGISSFLHDDECHQFKVARLLSTMY